MPRAAFTTLAVLSAAPAVTVSAVQPLYISGWVGESPQSVAVPLIQSTMSYVLGIYGQPYGDPSLGNFPPPDTYATVANYQPMTNAGFNLLVQDMTLNTEQTQKVLQVSSQVGIKMYVADNVLWGYIGGNGTVSDMYQEIDNALANYSSYSSYAGLWYDEPNASMFPRLALANQYLKQKDPAHPFFVNLLPIDCTPAQYGTSTYDQYVSLYLATVRPSFLSFDIYPLLTTGENPDYFANLEILRSYAGQAQIPLIQFAQAFQFSAGERDPSENDFWWQAFTQMAYGEKGFMYFTYWTPADVQTPQPALIDPTGTPTTKYPMVQRLNQRIQTLIPILSNLRSLDVYNTSPLPNGTHGFDQGSPVTSASGGSLVIGWLEDNHNTDYLVVANRDPTTAINASIVLDNKFLAVTENSQQTGLPQPASFNATTHQLSVSLAAGDGKLFQLATIILPTPILSLPAMLPINSKITLSYPSGYSIDHFQWTFTPQASIQSGSQSYERSTSAASSAGISFPTSGVEADLSQQALQLGTYQISVVAVDSSGDPSQPGTATVTLVESNLSAIRVYPNPFRASRGDQSITFDQMAAGSTVKIFTVSARLVTTLEAPRGSVSWMLANDSGERVASGIYLYLITDTQGNKTRGKFTVIR